MNRVLVQSLPATLGLAVISSQALADDPTGIRDTPPLSEIKEVVTSVRLGSYNSPYGSQCRIVRFEPGVLENLLATSLMQAGFPKALPGESHRATPGFIVEAVVSLQNSDPPTCLAAVRAELALGDARRLVFWSAPMVILEADAGSDPDKPSDDLQKKFTTTMRDLADKFIIYWGGVTHEAPDYLPPSDLNPRP